MLLSKLFSAFPYQLRFKDQRTQFGHVNCCYEFISTIVPAKIKIGVAYSRDFTLLALL